MSDAMKDDTAIIQEELERGRAQLQLMRNYVLNSRKVVVEFGLDARVNEILDGYKQERLAMQTAQMGQVLNQTAAATLKAGFDQASMDIFKKQRNYRIELIAQSLRYYMPDDHASYHAKMLVLGADYDEVKAVVEAADQNASLALQLAGAGKLGNLAP